MSSSRLQPGGGSSSTPNSYIIEYVRLTTNIGNQIDIKDLVQRVDVSESLYSPAMEVTMVIADATNFLESNQLGGNEKIEVKIKRSPLKSGSNVSESLEFEVHIAEIFGYIKQTQGMQVYQFRCVSQHIYHNQLKTLRRSFEGSIGKLVKDICLKDLKAKPSFINTETTGLIKGIYPNIRPVHAINWLMRNAFDSGSPFYFYETLKDGLVFDSHLNCIKKEIFSEYNNISTFDQEPGSPEGYEEERKRIRKLSSPLGISKLVAAGNGAYGSTLHTIDISTKEYKKDYFNHDRVTFKTLNSKKSFSDNIKFFDQTLSNMKGSKSHFVSTNSGAFPSHKNYHGTLPVSMLKAESYNANMEFMTHNVTINGDFNISVGQVVELKLTKSSTFEHLEDPNVFIDKYASGRYLVTAISHSFDDLFIQKLTLKKDSSEVDLNA